MFVEGWFCFLFFVFCFMRGEGWGINKGGKGGCERGGGGGWNNSSNSSNCNNNGTP